jgi:hypothetical protein
MQFINDSGLLDKEKPATYCWHKFEYGVAGKNVYFTVNPVQERNFVE